MENNIATINMNLDKYSDEHEYNDVLEQVLELLSVPEGYNLKSVQSQKQNGVDVFVFRYEKSSGENNGLGGEHFSFVVEKDNNKILGFTWMDKSLSKDELPTKEETKVFAKEFLDKIEPGMFEKLKNLWIDKHDEIITLNDERNSECVSNTISGMKYKCYLEDEDNYTWIIVGSKCNIITFEQEIIWNNGRVTEKWLHDSWLKSK
jgi:hypothetical protein